MISRRIFAAVALLCAFSASAYAQPYTKAQLNAQVGANLPDNDVFQITPQNVRTIMDNIINSIFPTAPVVSGNVACYIGTTGLLQDCGLAPAPSLGTSGFALIGNGASLSTYQGFLQSGSGAVARTWQSKAADIINVTDFGAACNGSTDDTTAIGLALAAANGKTLTFPAGAVCITQHLDICNSSTCQNSRSGGNVPIIVDGNGVTLRAPAAASGNLTFVYIEFATGSVASTDRIFIFKNMKIDGGGQVLNAFWVEGCVFCGFYDIGEQGANAIGCRFDATTGFIFANNTINRLNCNSNNTNSGTNGTGIAALTSTSWNGSQGCVGGIPFNAGNSFINAGALFNGALGIDIVCANNTWINADAEQNLSYGLSITAVVAAEFVGAQFSSNKNNRQAAGTNGDASVLNNDNSPGIQFFGGASDGTFTGITAALGNTLAMHGQTGFGYTANCNGSGHACMTLP